MSTKNIDLLDVYKMYAEGYGTSSIGKKYGVASNTIRRLLIKAGKPLRTQSEAQKLLLDNGMISHPTKGKKHSESTKSKQSEAVHNAWNNKNEKEKKLISEKSKKNWENRSKEQKEEIASKAAAAIRLASVEGSKLEKYLISKIREKGIQADWHVTQTLENEKLEIDILLPTLTTAIEVDGIFHYEAVFSEESYLKTVNADNTKNGLLLKNGYCVIRIKNTKKNSSNYLFEQIWKQLEPVLSEISSNYPKPDNRLFKLELGA